MRIPAATLLLFVPTVAWAGHPSGSAYSGGAAGHASDSGSRSSSSSSSSWSHTTSSSSSSSGSSHASASIPHEASHPAPPIAGGHEGTWGGYTGVIRDHRHGATALDRDHRTHPTFGADAGAVGVVEDPGYDPYAYAYPALDAAPEPAAASLGVPHFALELGTGMRRFGDPLGKQNQSIAGTAENYTLSGSGATDSAVTTQLRVLFQANRTIYMGAEGELGGVVGAPNAVLVGEQQGTVMGPASELLLGAAGVVGGMERAGHARFGVEVAAGIRDVKYAFRGLGQAIDQSVLTGVLEPRARAEYWVAPYVALGAVAGANVLEHADWMAGAYLAVHTRAFGD